MSFVVCCDVFVMHHWEEGVLVRTVATLVPLFQPASVGFCYSALAMHELEEKARTLPARQRT